MSLIDGLSYTEQTFDNCIRTIMFLYPTTVTVFNQLYSLLLFYNHYLFYFLPRPLCVNNLNNHFDLVWYCPQTPGSLFLLELRQNVSSIYTCYFFCITLRYVSSWDYVRSRLLGDLWLLNSAGHLIKFNRAWQVCWWIRAMRYNFPARCLQVVWM